MWKPSPFTPLTALLCGQLLKDVFPPGVLQIVSGDDKATFNVGAYLSNHPLVAKVSFTGSVPTGKRIMACAAQDVKRITLEMGGNDAAIVLADVDVGATADKVFDAAFSNTGQVCCAIKRCFVADTIYDKFVAAITAKAASVKVCRLRQQHQQKTGGNFYILLF